MAERPQECGELWTLAECAQWLRLSAAAVRCRLKRGQFPRETVVHVGRSLRFLAPRVKEWVLGRSA